MQYTNPVMIRISKGDSMLSPDVATNIMVGVSLLVGLYGLMFDSDRKQVYRSEKKNKLRKSSSFF